MAKKFDPSRAVNEAVAKWEAENSEDAIAAKVKSKLDADLNAVILSLLGFERDSWRGSEFRVDHCNGRSGESTVGDFLKRTAKAECEKWLAANLGKLKPLDAASRKSMQASFLEYYNRALSSNMLRVAQERAKVDAERLLGEAIAVRTEKPATVPATH